MAAIGYRGFVRGRRPLPVSGRGPLISAAMKTSASKIIAAANAYTARATMGTALTMVVKAAFATAAEFGGIEPGSPNVHVTDSFVTKSGPYRLTDGVNEYNGFIGDWLSQDIRIDGGDGSRFGFRTNSRYVGMSIIFGGTFANQQRLGLRVNGQWARSTDYSMYTSADYTPHWVVFDLLTTATRNVEFFLGQNGGPIGFGIANGATLAALSTPITDFSSVTYGDSWAAGAGLTNRAGFWQSFGEVMGQSDPVMAGRAGQGYIRVTDGRTMEQRIILDAGKLPAAQDLVQIYNSVNDQAGTTAQLYAKAAATVSALRAQYPNAWVVAWTGFTGIGGSAISSAQMNAFRDGALSAADGGTLVLDGLALGVPGVTSVGNLPNGQPHDSADGVHPGPNEIAYMTGVMKPALVSALMQRAGL